MPPPWGWGEGTGLGKGVNAISGAEQPLQPPLGDAVGRQPQRRGAEPTSEAALPLRDAADRARAPHHRVGALDALPLIALDGAAEVARLDERARQRHRVLDG